jgi:hypothetical protein
MVIEILLALILVDGRGTLKSKERTFVVLQLKISSHGEYSYYGSVFIAFEIFRVKRGRKKIDNIYTLSKI